MSRVEHDTAKQAYRWCVCGHSMNLHGRGGRGGCAQCLSACPKFTTSPYEYESAAPVSVLPAREEDKA